MNSHKQEPTIITLKITSKAHCVSLLGEAIQTMCLHATGNATYALEFQRAVVEHLNNIILHAYNNESGHDILVEWRQEKDFLSIDITDYGLSLSHLPPLALPDFDAENGRGWWIISSCVDKYFYKVVEFIQIDRLISPSNQIDYSVQSVVNSHSNVLTLIKYFPSIDTK